MPTGLAAPARRPSTAALRPSEHTGSGRRSPTDRRFFAGLATVRPQSRPLDRVHDRLLHYMTLLRERLHRPYDDAAAPLSGARHRALQASDSVESTHRQVGPRAPTLR